MDPLLVAFGIEVAAGTTVGSAKAVASALRRWARADEVTRLFMELDERLGEIPGLTSTGLEPLRDDAEFLRLLALFWSKGLLHRDAMVAAIERHMGETAEYSSHDLAGQVADAIDLFSARARDTDRELFALEAFRQDLRSELASLRDEIRASPQIRHVSIDWAPSLACDRLRRLVESDPAELAPLQDALEGIDDPRRLISALIADPPEWMMSSGHKRWSALGEIADGYGLWTAAADAFLRASDIAGANRAKLLARAAVDASVAGDDVQHDLLLDRARTLDPEETQVILAELRLVHEPAERLARLNEAPQKTDRFEQAALAAARLGAHLELGDWPSAERALNEVEALDPDNVSLREFRPVLVLEQNRRRAGAGEWVDSVRLQSASRELLDLRNALCESYRYGESGRLLARAVEALALAGEQEQASGLFDDLRDEEKSDRMAAFDLAGAAMTAALPQLAHSLIPDNPRSDFEQLAIAQTLAFSPDPDVAKSAVPPLEALLKSDDPAIRKEAAYARQVLSLDDAASPSDEAQRVLDERAPALGALLAAEQLKRDQRDEDAEARLLPFHDDPRVARTLIRWAGQREEWDRVVDLSRALVAKQPTPLDRLILGDALRRSGQSREALATLEALRREAAAPKDIRADAFAASAQLVHDEQDFANLERVTAEWLAFDASSQQAAWGRILALVRVVRPAEAVALAQELALEPRNVGDAELLAAAFDQGMDAAEAAREIAALSDRFERPERLEALFLITALQVNPEDRLGALSDQLSERLAAFSERFPDSQLIWSVPIDTSSPEGIDAFFRDYVEPGAEQVHELSLQVANGEMPLAALAGAVSKPVALVVLRTDRGLPLSFSDPLLASLERESAADSVGRSVVWDPVSIAVVGSLPAPIGDKIRAAFPASLIPQATLDDIGRTADADLGDREEYSVIGYDAHTQRRWIQERGSEEIRAERETSARALAIARSLTVRPDVDSANSTEIDEFLSGKDRERAFVTWPASIALAQREGKPLYSDDRFVRAHARRAGLQSFGTLELLHPLLARGLITEDERRQVRRGLREKGAHGVDVTLEELVDEARESGFLLTPALAYSLLDPTRWTQAAVVQSLRLWGDFLAVVVDENEISYERWVARVLDAAKHGIPHRSYGFLAEALLLVSWKPFEPRRRKAFQALIRCVRDLRVVFGFAGDPVNDLLRKVGASAAAGESEEVQHLLRVALVQDLEFNDQLRALGISLRRNW